MMNSGTAAKLIQPFLNIPELNMMIADDKGYVVAANNPANTKSYHHSAHRLFLSKEPFSLKLLDEALDRPVYEAIHILSFRDERIGTVIATGSGKDILGTVAAAAVAMEMLLKEGPVKVTAADKTLLFHKKLLGTDASVKKELSDLSRSLGFKESIIRVSILIVADGSDLDMVAAFSQIKMGPMHSRQDILIPLDERRLLIFKEVDDTVPKAVRGLKTILFEYIASLNRMPFLYTTQRTFFIGTMQNQLPYYQYSYGHARWLCSYKKEYQGNVVHFSDYILEYMESRIHPSEYRHIFQLYKPLFGDEDLEMFIHTITALFENNMNLAKTASVIYLHRNTLTFRLNKIKDNLNIDPVNSNQGRQWLHQLLHYYKLEMDSRDGE